MTPYSYRGDAALSALDDSHPIIVFDGHCAFCSGWANFVLRFDRRARYRLLPAQSALGRALYLHYGLDAQDYSTNLLIEDGLAWLKSEGSIRMAQGLGFPWSLAGLLRFLPLRLRDGFYDVVARNRFRIAGRREVCYAPAPGDRNRFL